MAAYFAVAVCFLGLVLFWSGLAKLHHPAATALAIADFGVTRTANRSAAFALSFSEILLALVLVLDVFPTLVLAIATLLFALFAFLIGRSLRAGRAFPCSCFGESQSPLTRWTLARASGLGIAAAALTAASLFVARSSSLADTAVAVAVAAALMGLAALGHAVPRLLRSAVPSPSSPVLKEPS